MRERADTLADGKLQVLPWDSEFWGLVVGRAAEPFDTDRWDVGKTGLVYLLVDADSPEEAQAAEKRGFRLMDLRVTLDRPTAPFATPVRRHHPADVDSLARIARVSHRNTRFYADPELDDTRCDDLYEMWLRLSCADWADLVLVHEHEGQPTGYVTLHLDGDTASIGLIAVDERRRRTGQGQALVLGAVDFAHSRGLLRVSVVTQGRNVRAQRLFQACGFRTAGTELWFHKHVARGEGWKVGPVGGPAGPLQGRVVRGSVTSAGERSG